jgi:Vanadium chloroperoxidase N-terminal domain
MKYKLATTLLVVAALVVATFSAVTTTARPALADSTFYVDSCPPNSDPMAPTKPPCKGDNVILRWDEQLLSTIRAHPPQTGPTITARALGVLHTATYDAWAAYDPVAKVTQSGGPKQQVASRINEDNKKKAISYAAARVLNDLFPVPSGCPGTPPKPFCPSASYKTPDTVLVELGYSVNPGLVADPGDANADPAAVGNLAAKAVLDFRYTDGSNQLGGYADTTYTPANQWNQVIDRWRWQPLCVLTALGVQDGFPPVRDPNATSCPDSTTPSESHYALQKALTPQWGKVKPFSLAASQYRVTGPPRNANGTCCSTTDIVTAVKDTGNLSDSSKARAEYWADGPKSEFPPGHTAVFAQALSRKKGHSLDTDAKLFFLVGNAMMDASIASWYQKFLGGWPTVTPFTKYDFVRPITAIREYYKTQNPPTVPGAWLGPNNGFGDVPAEKWLPYQALTVVTPGFPEYVSGHSTFTAAGATMLASFNGSDTFAASVIIKAGSSKIEPGGNVPPTNVTLTWPTFSDASNDAGMSRRWGGIHFQTGDYHGRALGRQVAQYVWGTGQNYIKGYIGK